MSEAYLGEIRMFAGNFAPRGWALCNGQLVSITDNEALFSLIGTTYGGDGQNTFALPDMRGRLPIHPSSSILFGQKGGEELVMLNPSHLPTHTHSVNASSNSASMNMPNNAVWGGGTQKIYNTLASGTTAPMNSIVISSVGGNQYHDNMMPSLTISFIISMEGYFPPQP
ncbi:phage tail protein [Priestia koreensis]|uniref:phage tail protein n=1 Tax=Priestia koreensis TaxID=284581 RepID=UPI003CFD6ACB